MLAILAMLAQEVRCAWLRVAPRLPSPRVALRGLGVARSGRESRLADRTGKPDLAARRLNMSVALRIEHDDTNRRPVTSVPTPASRVALPRSLIDGVAGFEQTVIATGMTLCRGDIADAAVPVLEIVPLHELHRPLPGSCQIGEPLERELGTIFRGSEQRLGEGVVIAHARARVGRPDAEPMQHGQHRRGLQAGAVVTVQHGARRHRMHTLGERRASSQMGCVLGAVGVMHLEADNLAAVEVQDQVQIEPSSLDLRRQERHIPAPDLAGAGGDVRARRA